MTLRALLIFLLGMSVPAAANNELTIARSSAPVADQVNTLTPPRNLPGATIDYMLTVTNPIGNVTATIRTLAVSDPIPDTVRFRVLNLNATGGPIEFVDGNLLTIPLGASGLGYNYGGLASTTDGVEFSNGTSWSYTPVDQGDGYDGNVRAIRVTLTGTRFATAGSFRLRYRVMLR